MIFGAASAVGQNQQQTGQLSGCNNDFRSFSPLPPLQEYLSDLAGIWCPSKKHVNVTVSFMTSQDSGGVYDATVERSSGDPQLDAECLEAVCTCIPRAVNASRTGLLKKRIVDFSDLHTDAPIIWHEVDDYFRKHPDQLGKVVLVHRIPLAARKLYPDVLPLEELHSVSNLMPIKLDTGEPSSDHEPGFVQVIRHAGTCWYYFFREESHPIKGSFLSCAGKIESGE